MTQALVVLTGMPAGWGATQAAEIRTCRATAPTRRGFDPPPRCRWVRGPGQGGAWAPRSSQSQDPLLALPLTPTGSPHLQGWTWLPAQRRHKEGVKDKQFPFKDVTPSAECHISHQPNRHHRAAAPAAWREEGVEGQGGCPAGFDHGVHRQSHLRARCGGPAALRELGDRLAELVAVTRTALG